MYQFIHRILTVLTIGIALTSCGGGSSPPPAQQPPPIDTQLDWDQGNWDEQDWQ